MKLVVGPVDVLGNLWVIRPAELTLPEEDAWQCTRAGVELRCSRSSGLETSVVSALLDGRAVGVLERARVFATRVDPLTSRLAELGVRAEWTWTDATTSSVQIDDDRSALDWFVGHWSDVLHLGTIAFEKRRRLSPPPFSRARTTSPSFAGRSPMS